jgi:hypothetical protein
VPWAWTDDLARLLIEQEDRRPEEFADWLSRPAAIRVPDDVEAIDAARDMAGDETAA